jgi:radical SAM superfamily enzyme YgiQ (UPF0313 family)
MKMKKVFLINPPSGLYRRDDRCQSRVEDQTVRIIFPPIDLAMLAAMARLADATPRIEDFPAMRRSWKDFEHVLSEFSPDVLVISTTSATVDDDLRAAEFAKKLHPQCMVLAKGEYLAHFGEEALKTHPALDIILTGEPEMTLLEILKEVPLANIRGILFRKSGLPDEFLRTEERQSLENPDTLPFPARDLLDNTLYRSPETGNPLTVIQANRGCTAQCIFCPAGRLSGFKLYLRSPGNIIEEVKECVERYKIREFLFNGDTFTMNKSWLLELCELIKESRLDIHWGCNSRVDTFDEERAQALKEAGCWVVAFGVESGVQEMIDRMKKKATLDDARRAVRIAKNAGLCTHAFYIIGLPWETRETLDSTLLFARELDTDFFDFNIAYPLPGTELYEIALRDGLFERSSLAGGSYASAAMRSYNLSSDELTRWRKKALLSLYLRPRFILRTLSRVAGKPRILKNYLREGVRRLRSLLR